MEIITGASWVFPPVMLSTMSVSGINPILPVEIIVLAEIATGSNFSDAFITELHGFHLPFNFLPGQG